MTMRRNVDQLIEAIMSDVVGRAANIATVVVALALLPPVMSASVAAQARVSDMVTCASCSIATERIMTLGTASGPGALPGMPQSATIDSQGRIWLLFAGRAPFLFGPDGTFIREVGRIGQGPGEFQRPWSIAAVGDSVVVFDQQGRATVIGLSGQHIRTISGNPVVSPTSIGFVEWPRTVLVAGANRQPSNVGYPLHFMDFSGAAALTLQSFGGDGVMLPDDPARLVQGFASSSQRLARVVASSGPQAIFGATRYTEYVVTRWDRTGRAVWHLEREATLFPKKATWTLGSSTTPPDSRMRTIWYDSRRYLWTLSHVAAPTWARARRAFLERNPPGPPPARGISAVRSTPASRIIPERNLYQTLIEIMDVESRTLVASRAFPFFAVATLPDGRIVTYHESDDGTPYVEIHSASLRGGA